MKIILPTLVLMTLACTFSACTKIGNADMISSQADYRNATHQAPIGMGSGTGKDYANGQKSDVDTRKPAVQQEQRTPPPKRMRHPPLLKE